VLVVLVSRALLRTQKCTKCVTQEPITENRISSFQPCVNPPQPAVVSGSEFKDEFKESFVLTSQMATSLCPRNEQTAQALSFKPREELTFVLTP
jgi:hypothetical protein